MINLREVFLQEINAQLRAIILLETYQAIDSKSKELEVEEVSISQSTELKASNTKKWNSFANAILNYLSCANPVNALEKVVLFARRGMFKFKD